MQSLFRFQSETNTGSVELRQWNYAQKGLLENLEKIEHYYQTYPIAVASSHLLAKLIISMTVSRTLSFDRYVANCNSIALQQARTLGISTALSKGNVWDGVFYGKNYSEIILGHDTLFPIGDVYTNWKDYQAVTVLQHEVSDLELAIPDGRVNSTSGGVAIVAINIPLLMAQYYCFNQEQDEVERNGGARRTLYQFIHSYALTGMLKTHLDCVYFNRLYNRLTGTPNSETVRKHSFFTNDYSPSLDAMADQQLDYLRKMTKRFPGVMKAVHLPVSGNLENFSELPAIPSTLQIFWALSLSRLKILSFLCLVQKDYEKINARELTTVRWLMRIHQTRRVIHSNLDMRTYYQIVKYLDIPGIE